MNALTRIFVAFTCVFLVAACSPDAKQLTLTKPAATDKILDVQKVVSDGGIEAWLVEDHSVPVVSISFSFKGGMHFDPPGKTGLARMASILLDEGAGEYDSQQFQKMLADKAIGLSFSPGRDSFAGSLQTITANRDTAFELLKLALTEPRFDEEPVERMRRSNLASIQQSLGKPGWLSARSFNGLYFEGHSYAEPGHGTPATIMAITPEDLHGFVKKQFARDSLQSAAAGDITPEDLARALDAVFGDLPERGAAFDSVRAEPQHPGQTILMKLPTPQTFISAGHPGIMRDDPDWHAAAVMLHILGGGGFTSRLMQEIREERGLTYSVSASMNEMDYASVIQAGMSVSNDKAKEALDLLRAEWNRMAETGVTEKELDDAKAFLTGSLLLYLTSTGDISGTLNGIQRYNLGIDYINKRNALIRAVTGEDIRRVAKKLLHSDRFMTILVGDPEGIEPDMVIENPPGMGLENSGNTQG